MKLLKELSNAAAVPGNETVIRDIVTREVKKSVDSLKEDSMGNLIAYKKGSQGKKKVMFACHMDEIGFYIKSIDDKGFLRVINVGGFDPRNLFARRVTVHTKKGELLGVMNPGIKPLHISKPEERKKVPEIHEFIVDLGLPVKEVKKKVKIGDMLTLNQECQEMGDLVTGKAMDNRVAVWTGINILKKVKEPKDDLYVVFTVQEEVGIRGAVTSSFGVAPDLGISIDTTLATDTPGISPDMHVASLGKGVAIKVLDSSIISDRRLVEEFVSLAEKKKISYQMEVLPLGGNDGAAIQRARSGAKTICLSVPTRYIHTVTETINMQDLKATLDLCIAYLNK